MNINDSRHTHLDDSEFSINQYSTSEMNDDDYHPLNSQNKRKKAINKHKKNSLPKDERFKYSLWQLEENVAYMDFIVQNRELFQSNRSERRIVKINLLMSRAVVTRSPDQCRSHHQKMMKYHHSLSNIVTYIQGLQLEKCKLDDHPCEDKYMNVDFRSQSEVELVDLNFIERHYIKENGFQSLLDDYLSDFK